MSTTNYKAPGVYINEIGAFPNSVVPVATAVPAFIGYTPQAEYQGQSYLNKAQRISSFTEFMEIYGLANPPAPQKPLQQYSPQYYLVAQKEQPISGKYVQIGDKFYSILPDPNTIYYLYNSIRLFYQNGGGDAYIVSVGSYGQASNKPVASAQDQIVNPNVSLTALSDGLEMLKNEVEPTLYICPEATLLNIANNGTLMQEMLLLADEMQTAVCLFDVIGGRNPAPINYTKDIETFRENSGSNGLQYGVAYYPFVETTLMQWSDMDFSNLLGGDIKQLEPMINPADDPNPVAASILNEVENPPADPLTIGQYSRNLANASKTYKLIMQMVLREANVLPASGGMAGVYTVNDISTGVWKAPANVSIVGVSNLPIKISASQQEGLNVDAVTGKSINAIRFFNGRGILVWGARTLDGNSNDWRYISVRRTMTMIEQSCKLASRGYVFNTNDANTWSSVKNMISNFLTGVWKQGGLQGTSAEDAFFVRLGLGETMTAEDVLNGVLRISIGVAVTRPAEFIVITFEQAMQKS